jgi:transcriptional regulator with XRE-family HTH domain
MVDGPLKESDRRIDGAAIPPEDRAFSREVGARLRAVRRQRGMSLVDVEERSDGRWSASALGAYERGFRNLSVPRLRSLAEFYQVPMGVLLGEPVADATSPSPRSIVLDLEALRGAAAGQPVMHFVNSIVVARGDFNGRVLSLRHDDIRALSALVGAETVDEGIGILRSWGVLIGVPDLKIAPDVDSVDDLGSVAAAGDRATD